MAEWGRGWETGDLICSLICHLNGTLGEPAALSLSPEICNLGMGTG